MRIGIDARFYGPSAGTGIGRYTNHLVEELEQLDTANDYEIFLRDENYHLYAPRNPRFRKVRSPWRWYSFQEQIFFPRLLRRRQLDLVHFLHFNVPVTAPQPYVVTIHDLILSKFPTERASTLGPVLYWIKHGAYKFVIRTAVRRARHILAVTNNTKNDVVNNYHVPRHSITVTYEAGALPLLSLPQSAERSLRSLGVSQPFVLYVGNTYPHKNLERLIEVVYRLRQRGEQVQLVIVGRDDYFSRRLRKFVDELFNHFQPPLVVFMGFVDDTDLDVLYRRARVYVCPSLYEGFGLPGLEAMTRGTPVAAARASSLPEVYGDAAEYFDPKSTDDIFRVVSILLHNERRRRELVNLGDLCFRKYSWHRMAQQTVAVYNAIGRGAIP